MFEGKIRSHFLLFAKKTQFATLRKVSHMLLLLLWDAELICLSALFKRRRKAIDETFKVLKPKTFASSLKTFLISSFPLFIKFEKLKWKDLKGISCLYEGCLLYPDISFFKMQPIVFAGLTTQKTTVTKELKAEKEEVVGDWVLEAEQVFSF